MELFLHVSIIFLTFAEGIVGGHVPMTRGNLIHPFPFTKDKIVKEIRYMRKLTQEQFEEKARSIHKGKYGYDRAVYNGGTSIVEIYCPIHGYFSQRAGEHLKGRGCSRCKAEKTHLIKNKGRDKFIEDAIALHGNKYGYDKVVYRTNKDEVIITCPKHGDFPQTPNTHLRGCGCPKCADERTGDRCRMTMAEFIKRSTALFGGRYDYSLINKETYKGYGLEVPIICPVHGEFKQSPQNHLSGRGCYKCGKASMAAKQRYTRDELVELFRKEFGDKYDYSNFKEEDYKNRKSKIKVICPEHGVWEVSVDSHLYQKSGCPSCKRSRGEEVIANYLDDNKIEYIPQYKISNVSLLCLNKNILVDFYLPKYNTIIEFNGIQHYKDIQFFNERTFEQQQWRDDSVRRYCKIHGIKLIEIPYTEINNVETILKRKLRHG